jgi:succinate dehydrogenase / fumarate reductase, cytochrome b subunit
MSTRLRVFSSSVATKILIGVTGLALFAYLLIHIIGNLMIFFGPAFYNKYAYTLEGNPLIPVIEIGLLLIFLLHVYKTVTMYLANWATRPIAYKRKEYAGRPSRKSIASSTMIFSGLWLLLFIIIHVKAFRFGTEYPWPAGGRDLYRQEMENFTSPLMLGFYLLSMLVVGSHLWHGAASSVQSLGLDHPRWTPRILLLGKIMAVLIASGFIVITVWAHLKANGVL